MALGALLAGVGVVYWLVVARASEGLRQQSARTRDALVRSSFSCPEGSAQRVEPWSKAGWSRFCVGDEGRTGLWQAWESERLAIEGSYHHGREEGIWRWFHPDGSTFREIEYVAGQAVRNEIASEARATEGD